MGKYYIERQASGYVGNCLLWWRKGGRGYTCDLSDAEVFDSESAQFIDIMSNNHKYRAWPKKHIDENTSVHVDHQRIDRGKAIKDAREAVNDG